MISRNTEEFQWDNLEFFCFSPTTTSIPSGKEIRKPRIANSLYLGCFPKEYGFSFGINGIRFEGEKVNCIFKARRHSIQVKNEPLCLIMELENDTIQFIELDDIMDAKSLKTLDNWITNENKILLKIANEYEQFNRQFYHFMYDIISLSKEISKLEESEQDKLLHETKTALILLHNRIQAEVSSAYRLNGKDVTLFPVKLSDNHKPDLMVSDTYVDIKTIIIPGRDKNKLLKNFVKRLEKILKEEQEEDQVGQSGSFFVGIWSGFLSSIFYTSFKKFKNHNVFQNVKLYESIPPLTEKKLIFVLPSPDAFHNYYLVVERSRAVRISNFIYKKGFEKIKKSDMFSYLALTNIRKGCPFGLTGKNPMMIFKLT